jgi:hypothetical protein
MAKVILRYEKIHDLSVISQAERHHLHARGEVQNADPSKSGGNRILVGSTTPAADVQARLDQVKTIRSNAVLMMDGFASASPEFFEGKSQAEVDQWVDDTMAWLKQTHGENLVFAHLQVDETTPHIHFWTMPIDENGKLNARKMFNPKWMTWSQTDYPKHMQARGHALERGLEGSTATHTTIKQFYGALNQSEPTPEAAAAKAKERDLAVQKKLEQDRKNAALIAKNHELQQERDQYKALLDSLRTIPLDEVLPVLGYDWRPTEKVWKCGDSTITVKDAKFFDHEAQHGGGGAFDLVMHATGHDFKGARQWLADRFGESRTIMTVHDPAITNERTEIRIHTTKQGPVPFVAPDPDPGKWDRARAYLTETRCLAGELVDELHRDGRLFADKMANCVFTRTDQGGRIVGVSKRGTGPTPFKQCLGPKSDGYFTIGDQDAPDAIAVCESAIDAVSLYERRLQVIGGETTLLCLSTDGASGLPDAVLDRYPGARIFAAQDNNRPGERMAAKLMAAYPDRTERLVSIGVDWNDDLRTARTSPEAPAQRVSGGRSRGRSGFGLVR